MPSVQYFLTSEHNCVGCFIQHNIRHGFWVSVGEEKAFWKCICCLYLSRCAYSTAESNWCKIKKASCSLGHEIKNLSEEEGVCLFFETLRFTKSGSYMRETKRRHEEVYAEKRPR